MAFVLDKQRSWSDVGLRLAVISTALTFLLGIVHGFLERPEYRDLSESGLMLVTWSSDTRLLFEQCMYIGALIFVGAKFFETRTIFSIGFDTHDADKISMKGPDEDNIVWIGHRYASALEAHTVALAIEKRLKPEEVA
jgi:hypothetical protein